VEAVSGPHKKPKKRGPKRALAILKNEGGGQGKKNEASRHLGIVKRVGTGVVGIAPSSQIEGDGLLQRSEGNPNT